MISQNTAVTDKTIFYFNKRAPFYHIKSLQWPWSWLRASEAEAIDIMLGDISGSNLLDLGCGAGYYARRYINMNPKRVVAIDLSPEMIAQISDHRIECKIGNAALIKVEGNFDKIISAGLLEFVEDAQAVFANARRHVNNDGHFVALLPRESLGGKAYQLFHRRHGIDITLFNLNQLHYIATKTKWTMMNYKFVFPFSMVATFQPSNSSTA